MPPRWLPSPNFGPRRAGAQPDLIVLHYTAMADCDAACARLCDPACEVSAHYVIAADGTVFQLVDEKMRAWHAGTGCWGCVTDVNSRSIGVELDNSGADPFAEPQMQALERLLKDVAGRHAIPPERIIGHSDMAPGRKVDPGPLFDWRRLARAGLSIWPEDILAEALPVDQAAFVIDLGTIGYPDAAPDTLLTAFRARFRPKATGALQAADCAAARDLARRFPVDRGGASA